MALADHFGAAPSTVISAILSALNLSCMKTVKVYAGDELTPEKIDVQLTAGVPAFLVANLLGPFDGGGTSRKNSDQTVRIGIVCAAGTYVSVERRLKGQAVTTDPGIEDLLDIACYYGLRAMDGVSGTCGSRLLQQRWLRVEPGKYLAVAELQYTRHFDAWSDAPANTLQALGIVHDPTAGVADGHGAWFDVDDNPISDWPDTTDGGVADPL